MKAALDVHYETGKWAASCVVFADWPDSEPLQVVSTYGSGALQYRPGRFYERELPALLSVLKKAGAGHELDTILIDGYVHLKDTAGKGLGVHLFESLAGSAAIVGIAKNPLKLADRFVPVWRGKSRKPLFVSAIGWRADQAARCVLRMHGPHRIPTLIRLADVYARAAGAVSA